jgi:hypothetical protein
MEGYTYGGERSAAIVDDGRGDGGYWRVRQRGWIVREEEKGRRGELAVQIVVTPAWLRWNYTSPIGDRLTSSGCCLSRNCPPPSGRTPMIG